MEMSYILYIGVLAICWLFAFLADRKDNKFYVWLIVALLTLISGLRAYSVGIDTISYVNKFSMIAAGSYSRAYGLEESFKYFCGFILMLFPENYSVLLTVLALITNGFIIWRLWDFRSVSSFSCMVACYYMGFFFMSLNGIRQFCAIGLLLYGTRFLIKHQHFRYILFVLAAAAFHRSALIGIVLLAIELLRWQELTSRKKLLFSAVVVASPVILFVTIQSFSIYAGYFERVSVNMGLMVPLKILFFLFTVLFVNVLYGKERHFANWRGRDIQERDQLLLGTGCYAVGLALIFMSYFLPVMNRVGWYFTIYEGFYLGTLVKTKVPLHKMAFIYSAAFLLGYGFIDSMIGDAQGVMPYIFIWQ